MIASAYVIFWFMSWTEFYFLLDMLEATSLVTLSKRWLEVFTQKTSLKWQVHEIVSHLSTSVAHC